MALKSADHVQAILALINADPKWATDFIWQYNKDDEDAKYVDLPDRSYRSPGGFLVIEQGRRSIVSTGEKLYKDEADFWKKMMSHWPRPPFKKSHWTRDYRKKEGAAIVRRFDMFAHTIFAITREENDQIVSIEFFGTMQWDGQGRPEVKLHEWTI